MKNLKVELVIDNYNSREAASEPFEKIKMPFRQPPGMLSCSDVCQTRIVSHLAVAIQRFVEISVRFDT